MKISLFVMAQNNCGFKKRYVFEDKDCKKPGIVLCSHVVFKNQGQQKTTRLSQRLLFSFPLFMFFFFLGFCVCSVCTCLWICVHACVKMHIEAEVDVSLALHLIF